MATIRSSIGSRRPLSQNEFDHGTAESVATSPCSISDTATFDSALTKGPKYTTLAFGAETTWERPSPIKRPFSAQVARWFTANFWQILWEESWEDVCNVNWKRIWKRSWHCFAQFCVFLAALIPLAGLLSYNLLSSSVTGQAYDVCLPNGDFDILDNGFNPLSSKNLFQITLGVGQLAFSHAKIIDVSFDIIAGRVGQVVLGLIAYHVYTCALLRMMESSAISYGTFEAITLRPDSWVALWNLNRDFLYNKGVRARCTAIWLITSMLFIVAFPSFISAMSGYSANVEAFVRVENNMIQYSDFRIVRYIVHDAWRIGLTGDQIVAVVPGDEQASLRVDWSYALDTCLNTGPWVQNYSNYDPVPGTYAPTPYSYDWTNVPADCQLAWAVSNYTYTFGFNAHTHSATNITLNNRTISLPSPSLNITAASLIEQSSFYCQDPFTNHYQGSPTFDYQNCLFSPFSASNKFQNPTSSSNILYTQSGTNTTYPVSFLVDNGTCQQLATYKWGFSALLLLLFSGLLSLWALSTYAVYADALLHSQSLRLGLSIGRSRALLDLAGAMRDQLGDQVEGMDEAELAKLLRDGRGRFRVRRKEQDLPPSCWATFREWWRGFELLRWAWAEKYWLLLLAVLVVCTATIVRMIIGGIVVIMGTAWTLALGRGVRSRWLVFTGFAIVGFPLCFVFVGH